MKIKTAGILPAVFITAIWLFGSYAFADNDAETMELIRQEIHADKKRFMALNMLFTKAESEEFWPLYDQYQNELEALGRRYSDLLDIYIKEYLDMTDEQAATILDDMLTIDMDFQNLRKAYLPKFRAILPNRKVARYFQLENKIQAVLRFDAAAQIPLT